MPNDHLRMLIALLEPATPDLARRWVASLLMVPPEEREETVAAVEERIAQLYGDEQAGAPSAPRFLHLREPAQQRDGYTEEVVRTYEVKPEGDESAARADEPGGSKSA